MRQHLKKIPFLGRVSKTMKQTQRYIQYLVEFYSFAKLQKLDGDRFTSEWRDRYPCLDDKTAATSFDAHYTYHPAWAARILAQTRPSLHVDISSSLHFCTMVSAFIPIKFYDYRPADLNLSGLESKRGDLMQLPFADDSVESLSCMHVIEHIGLGRYGDPLDLDGDLKAITELKRVLSKGGSLLFVTPVGKPKIRFNAHRIYSYDQITSYFAGLKVEQFALVDDNNKFTINADPAYANEQSYGCGCWWFRK